MYLRFQDTFGSNFERNLNENETREGLSIRFLMAAAFFTH